MADYLKIGGERVHRLVWEEAHGRPVPDGYLVHHRNENKKDNRPENLKLMTVAEHNQYHKSQESPEARFVRTRGWRGRKQPPDMVARRVAATKARWAENGRKRPAYLSYLDEGQCKRGHDMSGDNLAIRASGYRYCRKCRRMLERKAC